jgi:hypothetical protein
MEPSRVHHILSIMPVEPDRVSNSLVSFGLLAGKLYSAVLREFTQHEKEPNLQ